jgi:DNA repair exonuclease SbcCD ATPase subunit/DNA repair exonuclease SbcCD nuclease subunit
MSSEITEKILEPESREIRFIYHSADIHVPNRVDRHDEYRYVFKKEFEALEQQEEKDKSIMVICGDIFDSKTSLKPECISMVVKYLERLQKIMPVIIILGNHDVNMSNSSRMDALTPIVEFNILRNVFLLKNTGIYHYGNITFGVTSVYDKKIFPASQIINRRKYLIGLCHKTIQGATIDNGRVMQSEVKEGFNGYSLMLMGDIHKHQYIRNEGTLCCYSGSLIQQNFGESLDGHGIVKWSLGESSNPEFIPIPNEYGFCTFDGKIDEEKLPPKPKIRVKNMDKKQAEEIESRLREKYDVKWFHADPPIDEEGDVDITADDETMLRSFLSEHKNIDEIMRIHNIVKNSVDMNSIECAKEKIFIKELKWKNMIIYGGSIENSIDFTQYKGKTVGIFAQNEMGKTSIIDIFIYALFGKYSRGKNLEIINWNEKEYECSLTFTKGKSDYIITRRGEKTDSVSLVKVINRVKTPINEDDKTKTEEEIKFLIGNLEDYKNTCITTADNDGNFIKMTNDGRMKMLRKMLRIDNFDTFCKSATGKKKDLDRIRLNIEEKIEHNNEEIKRMSIEETKKKIDIITENTEIVDVKIREYEDKENNIRGGVKEYKTLRDVSIVMKEKMEINKRLRELSQNSDTRENIHKKIELLCKIHKYDEADQLQMREKHEEFEKIRKEKIGIIDAKINENNRKITEEMKIDEKNIRDKEKEIKRLNMDDNENVEQIDSRITNLQALIVGMNKEDILSDEKINSIRKQITVIEKKILRDEKLDLNIDEIKKKKLEKTKLLEKLQKLNTDIELKQTQIDSLRQPISVFEECSFSPECVRCSENKERLNRWKEDNGIIDMDIKTLISHRDGLGNIKELKVEIDMLEKRENSLISSLRRDCLVEQITKHERCKEILVRNVELKGNIDRLSEKRTLLVEKKENDQQMKKVVKNVQIRKQNKEIEKEIVKLQTDKKNISDIKDVDYENYISELNSFMNLLNSLKNIDLNEERIKNIANDLRCLEKELQEIKENEDTLVNNEKIFSQIREIDIEKENKKKERDEFIIEKTKEEAKIRGANALSYENELLLTQCSELNDEIMKYDEYITAVGKKGIPFTIIKKASNKIQSEVNTFLAQCGVEYTISIECDEKTLRVLISDKKRDIRAVSGEQRFLISTAFRRVFSGLSTIVKTNFMWIDEGISSLDDFHINHIRNMFDILLGENDVVFVMSHLSHIQDSVGERINISSENGYSYLTRQE